MEEKLAGIKILWCQPDTLALWGIPYKMREDVGQQPYDLWKANRDWKPLPAGWHGESKRVDLSDWVYLGSPGVLPNVPAADQKAITDFLEKHKDDVPGYPREWSELNP